MIKPAPPRARGAAGVLFVFLLGVASAGVLVNAMVLGGAHTSILVGPGGRAMLGAAVALGAALIAFAMRAALGQPIKSEGEPGVRDHP